MSTIQEIPLSIISGSVDWITLTYKSSNKRLQVKTMADNLIEAEVAAGNRIQSGNFNGYVTRYAGQSLFGERSDGFLVRLSGITADKYWLNFLAYASNVTRIDLAATCFFESHPKDLVRLTYEQATAGLTGDQQRRYSLIVEAKGGQTFYIGSRTSSQYGRVYDKWIESNRNTKWLNAVRYEVEFKKPLSLQVATELSRQQDQQSWIASYIRNWFLTRGVVPMYNSTSAIGAIQIQRDEPDTHRRLVWLAKSVHPAYRQLVMAGFGGQARRAVEEGIAPESDDSIKEIKE